SSNSTVTLGSTALICDPTSQTQNCAIVDDKTIIANTPAGTAGKVAVTVTNADGLTMSLANAFEYGPNAPPSIDSLSVDNGPTAGGTYVTIFGENLDANATVTFDGVAAMVKTANPSFLGVFSPPHAAGMVDVVLANGDAQTAKTTFTYADDSGNGDGGTGGSGGTGGGDGTGGGAGGNGISGNNQITNNSHGCSLGGDAASAPSIISLMLVLGALGFALRRRRS
ncbi:MAG TPA: IPT/TIG domain-containing protein, partial [Polyangia bacterium]|nr:IPT/TIG domain-containing protein [Polyangia bacterium]